MDKYAMEKFAMNIIAEATQLGAQTAEIYKYAQMGNVEAQRYVWECQKAAEEAMGAAPMDPSMGEAPMDPGMDPAAMGGGAPPPSATIACPQCKNEVTPSPEGICPVCQFDFNTLAQQAAEQAVGGVANEVKAAALRDPQYMQVLIQQYGHLI